MVSSEPDANGTVADAPSQAQPDIDFNSTHHLITEFMTALQSRFIEETGYKQTLMNPQGNVFFVPDDAAVKHITEFVSQALTTIGGFAADEFNFRHRSGSRDGAELRRLRLDFTQGITLSMLQKIAGTTEELQKR